MFTGLTVNYKICVEYKNGTRTKNGCDVKRIQTTSNYQRQVPLFYFAFIVMKVTGLDVYCCTKKLAWLSSEGNITICKIWKFAL